MCKKRSKANRGQLKAARNANRTINFKQPTELLVKLDVGVKVRVRSLAMSRDARSMWAGKHGTIVKIDREHGMAVAHIRLINSWNIVRVPLADVTPLDPGREFAEKETNPTLVWNPMQSPFPSFH